MLLYRSGGPEADGGIRGVPAAGAAYGASVARVERVGRRAHRVPRVAAGARRVRVGPSARAVQPDASSGRTRRLRGGRHPRGGLRSAARHYERDASRRRPHCNRRSFERVDDTRARRGARC